MARENPTIRECGHHYPIYVVSVGSAEECVLEDMLEGAEMSQQQVIEEIGVRRENQLTGTAGRMAVLGLRGCSWRTRTSRDGRVPRKGCPTTVATATGGESARCWSTGTLPDTGFRFSFSARFVRRVGGRWFLGNNTTTKRIGSRRHDGRRDRKVRVGVEGVRAHPEVDSEGGGRVVQRRARRRDTDGRYAARATAARAPKDPRRLTSRHGRPPGGC